MNYARNNYETNPTEALSAILRVVQETGGQGQVDKVMDRLRNELGDDLVQHCIQSPQERQAQAEAVVQQLIADENTVLHEQGRNDLLRQTLQDGSSVVCSKCNDVVSSHRWQQHQQYWCPAREGAEDVDDVD